MAVRVVIKRRGIRDLLRSPEIEADLLRRATAIATAAGDGHDVESDVGRNRARAVVFTDTYEAAFAEAQTRNLTRAVDAGRV